MRTRRDIAILCGQLEADLDGRLKHHLQVRVYADVCQLNGMLARDTMDRYSPESSRILDTAPANFEERLRENGVHCQCQCQRRSISARRGL